MCTAVEKHARLVTIRAVSPTPDGLHCTRVYPSAPLFFITQNLIAEFVGMRAHHKVLHEKMKVRTLAFAQNGAPSTETRNIDG